jgi:anti-sigma B factor antagonist
VEEFNVIPSQDESSAHFLVQGELDIRSAPVLHESVESAIRSGLPVSLDISRLGFVDSAGLSQLVLMQKRARANGSKLTLSLPSKQFLTLLEITGLTEFFDFT